MKKYKIYSVYLYDNQLNIDYVILHKERDLGYWVSQALNRIYNDHRGDSVNILGNILKSEKLPFIKNDNFASIVKTQGTHLSNYNVCDIFWDEGLSDINVHEYDYLSTWNVDESTYSTFRIHEYKHMRLSTARENILESIGI